MNSIKTRIIKIGNSRGIRIPKPLIEQASLGDEVEITIQRHQLVIRSAASPRSGWSDCFRDMTGRGDDQLLDEAVPTLWDAGEWKW